MRYAVDTSTHKGFMLFISLPESGDSMASPMVAQFRGGQPLLLRLKRLLAQAAERRTWAEEKFHEVDDARVAFEGGDVLFESGDPLLVVTLQRRLVNVMAGSTLLVRNAADLDAFRKAIDVALKALKD